MLKADSPVALFVPRAAIAGRRFLVSRRHRRRSWSCHLDVEPAALVVRGEAGANVSSASAAAVAVIASLP
jgi:hypothetical protein